MTNIRISTRSSVQEQESRNNFYNLYKKNPLPENEVLANIGLFLKRQELTKLLFFNEVYSRFQSIHGIIIEFGTRWGQNLVTLNNLRAIYEPYNYGRKIVGFDSFGGFVKIDPKDGKNEIIQDGSFNVTSDYELYLSDILSYHESECPLSHIRKNIVIKGDAGETFEKYLIENPETIIAFAFFDFDVYSPTKKCLELLKNHITKGSIIGFDELNDHNFPGETIALKEVLSLDKYSICRNRFSGMQSYIIID
jgi:hypothetical protein